MQPAFSFGSAAVPVSPYAAQSPGYANDFMKFSQPVATPAPGPAAPTLNFAPNVGASGTTVPDVSVATGSGDSLVDSLQAVGLNAQMPVAGAANPTQMGWKGALGGLFRNGDGSFNMDGIGSLAKGIGGLGALWMGFQQNKLAQDALSFQKEAYQTNLANSIGSYNMTLEDRIRSRYAQEGRSAAAADRYISKHKLED